MEFYGLIFQFFYPVFGCCLILKKIAEVNDSIEGVRSTTNPTNSVFMNERSEDFNEGTEAHEVEKNFLLML